MDWLSPELATKPELPIEQLAIEFLAQVQIGHRVDSHVGRDRSKEISGTAVWLLATWSPGLIIKATH